jgi:hypothetical protein
MTVNNAVSVRFGMIHVIVFEFMSVESVGLNPSANTETAGPTNPVPFIVKVVLFLVILEMIGKDDVADIVFDPSVKVKLLFVVNPSIVHVIFVALTRTGLEIVAPINETDTVGPTNPVPLITTSLFFFVMVVMTGKNDVNDTLIPRSVTVNV